MQERKSARNRVRKSAGRGLRGEKEVSATEMKKGKEEEVRE